MRSGSAKAAGRLPEGYEWLVAGSWTAAVRGELRDMLESAGLDDPGDLSAGATRQFRGRGRPVGVDLPDGSRAVLRRYLHGGALRHILGRKFTGRRPRPLRELRAVARAEEGGASVPRVLAAIFRRGMLFHEGYLLTREEEGARDLVEVLAEDVPAGRLLAAVGGEARRIHEAGVWHADLHAKNVLVRGDDVILIDFDRARIMDRVPQRLRERSLLRFDRSLVKLGLAGRRVSRADRLRLFGAHAGERIGKEKLVEIATRCRRSLRWHQVWWKLEFGGRPGA